MSTQTGRAVARGEALADRVAVPARHDRRRDRPAGLELDRARARRCRSPTAGPGRSGVVRSSSSNSASTRSRQRSGPGLDLGRLVVVAEDPAVERRHRDVDARRAEVGDQDVAGRRRGRSSWRGGRPPVLGPTSPSATRPRSISSPTRWATIARPSPVRATSSERDRDRPSRISSRTVTRASSASSGSGANGRRCCRDRRARRIETGTGSSSAEHPAMIRPRTDFCT